MFLLHFSLSIFWQNLSPNGGGEPPADLLAAINRDFGSLDNLKTQLSASTVAVQGSGWGWLGLAMITVGAIVSFHAFAIPKT